MYLLCLLFDVGEMTHKQGGYCLSLISGSFQIIQGNEGYRLASSERFVTISLPCQMLLDTEIGT